MSCRPRRREPSDVENVGVGEEVGHSVSLHAEAEIFENAGEVSGRPVADGFPPDHQTIECQCEEHLVAGPVGDVLQEKKAIGVEELSRLL